MKSHAIPNGAKILIFCQTKKGCERLSKMLKYEGWDNLSLHGDKSQKANNFINSFLNFNRRETMQWINLKMEDCQLL